MICYQLKKQFASLFQLFIPYQGLRKSSSEGLPDPPSPSPSEAKFFLHKTKVDKTKQQKKT